MSKQESIDYLIASLTEKERAFYAKALAGDPESQIRMGLIAEDWSLYDYAVEWDRKAVVQGYLPAYIELGILLEDHFQQDYEALDLFLYAARHGKGRVLRNAITELFYCYDSAILEESDLPKITDCLKELAEGGNEYAALLHKELIEKNNL